MTQDELVDLLQAHEGRDVESPLGAKGLVSDQPPRPKGGLVTAAVTNLTDHQKLIIRLCNLPRIRADLTEAGLAYVRERIK